MALKRKHKRLLMVAGVGVGGFLAYRYIYQPWAAQRAATAAAGGAAPGAGGLLSALFPGAALPAVRLPSPASVVSAPTSVGGNGLPPPIGSTTLGPQYSGALGACIKAKGGTWSPEYCQQRLTGYVTAAANARAAINALSAPGANPAAAGIPAAQAQLAVEKNALAAAVTAHDQLVAAGDPGAANYQVAIIGHQNDIQDLETRIAAASTANDNSAAIAAWEGSLAALDSDYFNLTGAHLTGGV